MTTMSVRDREKSSQSHRTPGLASAVRRELLRLADHQEALAAEEAMEVPYWVPCPRTVIGHRAAATALRENADRLVLGPSEERS